MKCKFLHEKNYIFLFFYEKKAVATNAYIDMECAIFSAVANF